MKNQMKNHLLAAAILTGLPILSHAQMLTQRPSDQFTDYLAGRSYEGDVLPQSNTGAPFVRRSSGTITTESVADGFLTFQKPSSATLSYQVGTIYPSGPTSPTWWTDNADPANGFTVEFRLQALDDAVEDYSFNFISSYNNTDLSQALYITASSINWGNIVIDSSSDNSDGFHVFRLVNLPDSSTYELWRDNVLLSDSLAGLISAPNRFWFGHWGGGAGGGVVDYLRWDTSGAYSPVPEPSTFLTVLLGFIALAGHRCYKRTTPRNRV